MDENRPMLRNVLPVLSLGCVDIRFHRDKLMPTGFRILEVDGWDCAKRVPAVSRDINKVLKYIFFILLLLDIRIV